jgi:Spy/CpxP family protein refolding chaperone
MWKRISLLLVVTAVLCTMAFTIGGAAAARQNDSNGIPLQHPVQLSLQFRHELNLTNDQVGQLEQLRDSLAKEFAPLREQVESLQSQMAALQQNPKPDEDSAKNLQHQGDELGAKVHALFDRYAQSVAQLLSDEQRQKLMQMSNALSKGSKGPDFVMMFIMDSREKLGLTPQQFTRMQYLQADFIRAFAPLREQMELLQMEVQEKFGKAGQQPTSEYQEKGQAIQKQVSELQSQFSDRAIKEVLLPDQKAKLEEMLHGEHRPEPAGK